MNQLDLIKEIYDSYSEGEPSRIVEITEDDIDYDLDIDTVMNCHFRPLTSYYS